MNISKINSASFSGSLRIEDRDNTYLMDTYNITGIEDDMNKKETHIYNHYNFGPRYLAIPYSVIPPSKIIAAYTAASMAEPSKENNNIYLKNKKGKCTLVG